MHIGTNLKEILDKDNVIIKNRIVFPRHLPGIMKIKHNI